MEPAEGGSSAPSHTNRTCYSLASIDAWQPAPNYVYALVIVNIRCAPHNAKLILAAAATTTTTTTSIITTTTTTSITTTMHTTTMHTTTNKIDWLLELYILATSKDISGRVPTCDSVHSWHLYSVASLGDKAASIMT